MSDDPYKLLEVERNSTIAEIKKRYCELKWPYDCRKELGKLTQAQEAELNNLTEAYHQLSTDYHHLIISGYHITLAINSEDNRAYPVVNAETNSQLTEEEIAEIVNKPDIYLQELQDQEDKEREEQFKKLDLALKKITDQEEYEEVEKKFTRINQCLEILETKDKIKKKN